jgi:hypothetical protein
MTTRRTRPHSFGTGSKSRCQAGIFSNTTGSARRNWNSTAYRHPSIPYTPAVPWNGRRSRRKRGNPRRLPSRLSHSRKWIDKLSLTSRRDREFESTSLQRGVSCEPYRLKQSWWARGRLRVLAERARPDVDRPLSECRLARGRAATLACHSRSAGVTPSSIPRAKSDEASTLRLSSDPNKRQSPPTMTIMASRRKRAVDVSMRGTDVKSRTPIPTSRPDK